MNRRNFNKTMGLASLGLMIPKPITKKCSSAVLTKGDCIGLIAPGSPITQYQLDAAKQNLHDLGLKVKYDNRILDQHGFLAGTDSIRVTQIHNLLSDPKVKAIWAIRGGYGCGRLLPLLDKELIRTSKKILLGYSDLTALINPWSTTWQSKAFHSPMPKKKFSEFTRNHLVAQLFNSKPEINWTSNLDNIPEEGIQGRIVGGNLTVLSSLVGTDYELDYNDKILFLEDIGEKPYRLDRMLTQMHQSNSFENLKAIILGQFTDCQKPKSGYSFTLEETLHAYFNRFNVPLIDNFPTGHIDDQVSIEINSNIILKKNKMTFL